MGDIRSVRYLVEHKANINYILTKVDEIYTPLLNAIKAKSRACIQILVQRGADEYYQELDKRDQSPIFKVIQTQDKKLVEALFVNLGGDLTRVSRYKNLEGLSLVH